MGIWRGTTAGGRGRGIGRGTTDGIKRERENASEDGRRGPFILVREPTDVGGGVRGQKKQKQTVFGLYVDPETSRTILNPGTTGERLIMGGTSFTSASGTNIDIGFKPHSLK
nr:uncharacterized protein LOC108948289 [Nicotiana tomentosiformis]